MKNFKIIHLISLFILCFLILSICVSVPVLFKINMETVSEQPIEKPIQDFRHYDFEYPVYKGQPYEFVNPVYRGEPYKIIEL